MQRLKVGWDTIFSDNAFKSVDVFIAQKSVRYTIKYRQEWKNLKDSQKQLKKVNKKEVKIKLQKLIRTEK